MDLHRVVTRMFAEHGGETPVRHRTGVVAAINSDGTVNVTVSGLLLTGVPCIRGAGLAVGNTAQILVWAGGILVIGRIATNASQVTA